MKLILQPKYPIYNSYPLVNVILYEFYTYIGHVKDVKEDRNYGFWGIALFLGHSENY